MGHRGSFDGNDLTQVTGLTILATNGYLMPKRNVVSNNVVRSNMSKVATGFYDSKDITLTISITRDTRANVEISRQNLLGLIQGLEKDLIIYEAGEQRRYTATYSDYVFKQSGGSYLEFDLVFSCSDRFGYSTQYEKLVEAAGRTLYNYTDSFTVGGNAPTQMPVITAFLSAITAATTNTVTIGNVATSRAIVISRAWTAGDRLVIDVKARTVTVNGVAVDFFGAFPELVPGVSYINYQDNFSARTLDYSIYYYRRYI